MGGSLSRGPPSSDGTTVMVVALGQGFWVDAEEKAALLEAIREADYRR